MNNVSSSTAGRSIGTSANFDLDYSDAVTRKKTNITSGELRDSLVKSAESGSKSEVLINYLKSGNTEHLEGQSVVKALDDYLKKVASSAPDALREIANDQTFRTYAMNSYAGDRKKSEAIRALISFFRASDTEREKVFNQLVLPFYQGQDGSFSLANADVMESISDELTLKPLVSAMENSGLNDLLDKANIAVEKGENPTGQNIDSSIYEKAIEFNMQELKHVLNEDTGAIESNGEVLVPALRISNKEITALGLDPFSTDCPIKQGTVNWYNFVEKMKKLAMQEDKSYFTSHVINTFSAFNAIYRQRIKDLQDQGASRKPEVERLKQQARNLVNVFRHGYAGIGEAVPALVQKAFDSAALMTEDAENILAGGAKKQAGDRSIKTLVDELQDHTKSDTVEAYKGVTGSGSKIKDLVQDAGQQKITVFNKDTLAVETVTITRSEEANGTTEVTFGNAARSYEDAVKAFTSGFRSDAAPKLFGKDDRPIDPDQIEKLNKKITDDVQTLGRNAIKYDPKQKRDAFEKISADLLLAYVNADQSKAETTDEGRKTIAQDFVLALAQAAGRRDGRSERGLVEALEKEIAVLTLALNRNTVTAGSSEEAEVKGAIKNITDKLIGCDLVKTKSGYRFKTEAKSDRNDAQQGLAMDSLFSFMVDERGLKTELLDKVIADPSTTDTFSQIDFTSIDAIIEGNEALKDRVLANATEDDGIQNLGDVRKNAVRAGTQATLLYGGKNIIKSDTARNAAKLMAFIGLLKEAKVNDTQIRDIAKQLFKAYIKADTEREKQAKLERVTENLRDLVDSTDPIKVKRNSGADLNFEMRELVDITGRSAVRSLTLKEYQSIVDQRESSIAAGRVGAMLKAFSGKSISDMADTANPLSESLRKVLDKSPQNVEELLDAMNGLPQESQVALRSYLGMSGDEFVVDKGKEFEGHNAVSTIERLVTYFKSLATKLKLMKFYEVQNSAGSSSDASNQVSSASSSSDKAPEEKKEEELATSTNS